MPLRRRHVHIRLAFSWKAFALLTILQHSRDAVTGVRRFHDNQERCRAATASNEGIGTTIERSRRNESRPLRVDQSWRGLVNAACATGHRCWYQDGKEWLLRGCTEREHITGWLVGNSYLGITSGLPVSDDDIAACSGQFNV
jgi:hypothetical protein